MKFEKIFKGFDINGDLINYKANKEGHINSTYISSVNNNGKFEKYTHQKINKNVFKNPDEVMKNIYEVTSHIKNKLNNCSDIDQRVLQIIKTKDNNLYFIDEENNYWRTYKFIDNVKTFQKVNDENQAFLLGKAVGNFQQQLSDLDGNKLYETIKDFHNMRFRYEQFDQAVKNDMKNRLSLVKDEVEFFQKNRERGYIIWDLYNSNKLKTKVTHNDTKINNILFSNNESEALCVIDLDTVMPGTILFDVGDMIRTATSSALEDEIEYKKMEINVHFFKSLIKGYLSIANSFISKEEKSLLIESGRNITQIMGLRFLTDYLNGDTYYQIKRENHNIDRCRTQIQLIKDMDKKWDILNKCII